MNKKVLAGGALAALGILAASCFGAASPQPPSPTPQPTVPVARQHYSFAETGIKLSETVENKVSQIADCYFARRGKDLVVTSGVRSEAAQAEAMFVKLEAGDDLAVYANQNAVKQIREAYEAAKGMGKSADDVKDAMTGVIEAQTAKGVFISRHLIAGAVDIRSRDMTEQDKAAFQDCAGSSGDAKVILEGTPPHFHMEVETTLAVTPPDLEPSPTPTPLPTSTPTPRPSPAPTAIPTATPTATATATPTVTATPTPQPIPTPTLIPPTATPTPIPTPTPTRVPTSAAVASVTCTVVSKEEVFQSSNNQTVTYVTWNVSAAGTAAGAENARVLVQVGWDTWTLNSGSWSADDGISTGVRGRTPGVRRQAGQPETTNWSLSGTYKPGSPYSATRFGGSGPFSITVTTDWGGRGQATCQM